MIDYFAYYLNFRHHHWNIWSILFCTCLLAACAQEQYYMECRDTDDVTPVDTSGLVQFDSLANDAQTLFQLCGEDGPRFDNRFSPYKGGDLSSDVVVEHWAMLKCPHCAHFTEYVNELLRTRPEVKNRVRFYFHHYTWNDYVAYHQAAFAVSQQGMDKFWRFHDILFANTSVLLDYLALRDIAMYDVDVDIAQYDLLTSSATAEGQKALAWLEYEKNVAQANCVFATPTVYVCGRKIDDWPNLGETLSDYLKP